MWNASAVVYSSEAVKCVLDLLWKCCRLWCMGAIWGRIWGWSRMVFAWDFLDIAGTACTFVLHITLLDRVVYSWLFRFVLNQSSWSWDLEFRFLFVVGIVIRILIGRQPTKSARIVCMPEYLLLRAWTSESCRTDSFLAIKNGLFSLDFDISKQQIPPTTVTAASSIKIVPNRQDFAWSLLGNTPNMGESRYWLLPINVLVSVMAIR